MNIIRNSFNTLNKITKNIYIKDINTRLFSSYNNLCTNKTNPIPDNNLPKVSLIGKYETVKKNVYTYYSNDVDKNTVIRNNTLSTKDNTNYTNSFDEAVYRDYVYSNIKKNYDNALAWGIATSIDCKNCHYDKIRDEKYIKQFVIDLCNYIDMKRYGETTVINFGEDERVEGYSMVQLIETSLISGHFCNYDNSAYIDIFSCKFYNPFDVLDFTKKYFNSNSARFTAVLRY